MRQFPNKAPAGQRHFDFFWPRNLLVDAHRLSNFTDGIHEILSWPESLPNASSSPLQNMSQPNQVWGVVANLGAGQQ
jgi:hypothetical protein